MSEAKIIFPLQTTFLDYPDNISQAVLIYFLGCDHYCKDCHNPELSNYDNSKGKLITVEKLYNEVFKFAQSLKTNKIVLSGGDPLYKENLNFTRRFLNNYGDIFDICVYTGHSIRYVKKNEIKNFKFIKCDKYMTEYKTQFMKCDEYMQLSSTNQKFFNEGFNQVSRDGRYYFN